MNTPDLKKRLAQMYSDLEDLRQCMPSDGSSQKVLEARDLMKGALGIVLENEKKAELDALIPAPVATVHPRSYARRY